MIKIEKKFNSEEHQIILHPSQEIKKRLSKKK